MLSEQIIDNEDLENVPTEDETNTNVSTLPQDQDNTDGHTPMEGLNEEHITEMPGEVNPMYEKMTTSSQNNLVEYHPDHNEENHNENGDSIQINIHLIEETDNSRGTNIQKSLQLIISLSSISLRMCNIYLIK